MSPVSEAPTATAETNVVQYAGFWRRFVAYLLDSIILSIVFWGAALAFGIGLLGTSMNMNGHYDPNATGAAMSGIMLIAVLFGAGGWLYFALMESSKNQGTLGKMALGLRVTDLAGKRISFGKATGRFFAKILSSMTLCIGYIMAGFTAKKQALHDFVAGTLVLSKQSAVPAQVAQNAFAGS